MSSKYLEDRLRAHRHTMTPAVLRVAQHLADHPERALSGTAAEIASSVGTSDATVIRAVQSLGYSGLPELRKEVGDQLVARYDPRDSLDQDVARVQDDPRSVLDTVVNDALLLLNETRELVDHDDFHETVQLLASARRLMIIGWGTTGAVAEYAALSLTRLGRNATAETQSGFRLSDSLSTVDQDCVIVLLAPLLHVREIDITLEAATAAQARTVLITELLSEKLRSRVAHVLITASSQRSTASEVVGLVTIIDALLLGVAATNPESAHARWTSINNFRSKFSTAAVTNPPVRASD